jgi:hypothetical protein
MTHETLEESDSSHESSALPKLLTHVDTHQTNHGHHLAGG